MVNKLGFGVWVKHFPLPEAGVYSEQGGGRVQGYGLGFHHLNPGAGVPG
jgi:hypothetical protein